MIDRTHRLSAMVCLLFAVCCVLSARVHAQVPHLVRYQGQAVDANNVPLEGPHTLTFRLYNAETGGTKEWEEVHADVPIAGGHFSILLGEIAPLDMDWTIPCWISIQVGTEPELSPRQRLTSVPLALRAETAEKLAGGSTSVSARVYNSANISIPNNTEVKLTFDSERWDTDAIHSTTANTSRLTAPTAGKYFIYAHVVFSPNPTGYRLVRLKVNGAGLATQVAPGFSADHTFVSVATHYQLAAGDYVETAVIQSSGGSLSIWPDANDSPEFGMVRVD